MTEDPYRWLEAIANRREYIRNQLTGGSPVLAASLAEGILLLGVGTGQSKVFEIFDRQALAGLGHPADLERIRQSIIDAAHLEGFTRAPEDVALRRLVGQGLGPQLKAAFEQIFAPPFLIRLLLAEVGPTPAGDVLVKLGFDGSFTLHPEGVVVVADNPERETAIETQLAASLKATSSVPDAARALLVAWHQLQSEPATAPDPAASDLNTLLATLGNRTVEAALLRRAPNPVARYEALDPARLGFPLRPSHRTVL
jgi:proteasome alpha subunit